MRGVHRIIFTGRQLTPGCSRGFHYNARDFFPLEMRIGQNQQGAMTDK
jgi:hypothetical protein